MEKQSFELIRNLKSLFGADLDYIYLNKSQANLIWWVPLTIIKSLLLIKRKNYDVIHICDGALAPLGWLLKKVAKKRVTVTIHGLDLTYKNKLYQATVPFCIKKLDRVFCVSKNTANISVSKGIDPKKIAVIPNGINPSELKVSAANPKTLLSEQLRLPLSDKTILLTVGRLVKRKGVSWFIREVFPGLKKARKNIVYIIVGEGKASDQIKKQIGTRHIKDILLLGQVNQNLLKLIYNSADCLVMPNIPVPGDLEGFGIVAVEASSLGVPVVASNVDGISGAVIDNKNGFLVEPMNGKQFSEKIMRSFRLGKKQRDRIKSFTENNFSWKDITARYIKSFRQLIDEK